jgi:hypothetical protein
MYDKPKVTIDLDEYNALLRDKAERDKLDDLEINSLVIIRNHYEPVPKRLSICAKSILGNGIKYDLGGGFEMYIEKPKN